VHGCHCSCRCNNVVHDRGSGGVPPRSWSERHDESITCLQARYFFQQLVAGVEYCHIKVRCPMCQSAAVAGLRINIDGGGVAAHIVRRAKHGCRICPPSIMHHTVQGVCHRDLKLENVLLAGKHAPLVKICDFGYSKVLFHTPVLGHSFLPSYL
jgi:serine/threonine protein kinase